MKRIFLPLLLGWAAESQAQQFDFYLTSDTITYGIPGGTYYCYAMIENNTTTDLEIDVIRKENNLAPGWLTAMCLDICLPYYIDSSRLYLPAGQSQSYTMYFYTDTIGEDTSNALILFRNVNDPVNIFYQRFHGVTGSSLDAQLNNNGERILPAYPNPFTETTTIEVPGEVTGIMLYDYSGRQMEKIMKLNRNVITLGRNHLPAGYYLLRISSGEKIYSSRLAIFNP